MSLNQKFEKFMLSLPSIEAIDSIVLSHKDNKLKKADYLAMGRKLIIEQKCINQDQADKVQIEIDEYSQNEDYPMFYDKRDINLIIDKLPNKDEINAKIYSKITRLLENYLSRADKQIESTRQLFKNFEALGVLVILNEKVKVLSPEIVSARISQRLKEQNNGRLRFNNIDYVIFVSETHHIKGIPCVIVIEGAGATLAPSSISSYIDYLIKSWAYFNGGDCLKVNGEDFFNHVEEKCEPPPKDITRQQDRVLWYHKNRYMKDWTDNQVNRATAKLIDKIKPYVLKGGPKIPTAELAEMMMPFSDFIEESNIRGLDLRELKKYHSHK